MIKNTNYVSALLLAAVMSSCALANPPQQHVSVKLANITYIVKPGDKFSEIARQVTGDASNWRTIAQHNNLKDPVRLTVGDALIIPRELLENVLAINRGADELPTVETVQVTGTTKTPLPVTTGKGVSIARGAQTPSQQSSDVSVYQVRINRSFDLKPLHPSEISRNSNTANYDSQAPQIKVLGTYYPIGIYAQPANYARLVSRVSPGTLFQLDSVVNDWYKIVTEEGVRYIRQSDGALIK